MCLCVVQKEAAIHHSKLKDGPFRLNLHPRDYFQGNPYRSDKPLLPANKPLPSDQKISVVPFKPPSPNKKVIPPSAAPLQGQREKTVSGQVAIL